MFHQEFSSDVFALRLFTIIHVFVSYALQSIYEQESDDGVWVKVKTLYLSWEFSLDMFANTFTLEAEDIKDELEALHILLIQHGLNENLALQVLHSEWSPINTWRISTQHTRSYQSESPKETVYIISIEAFSPYFLQVGNPSQAGNWILIFHLTINLHLKTG